ncbi:hypothetical protein FHS29_002966 [Saccharothrix tamanrassetensis]|uniref:Uncharacterized protein n=1 Tax=Saccharothrix tamanrassetensis TaxID=1051531 RepID=A0A841CHB9_9PSEU|nr:hypothetical protein [Saccharothrix tamanrassetensis]MBB5956380.1 hypothetical protein [Saccharothrix tamanrassetensis]
MSEPVDDAAAASAAASAAAEEAARRRRLVEVFGDVLPEADDEPTAQNRNDQWYLENRPPHHE